MWSIYDINVPSVVVLLYVCILSALFSACHWELGAVEWFNVQLVNVVNCGEVAVTVLILLMWKV